MRKRSGLTFGAAFVLNLANAAAASSSVTRMDTRVGPFPSIQVPTGSYSHDNETPAATMIYYGGPVLANVEVITVFWSNGVRYMKEINQFYYDITDSPYFDWLSEYNTRTQNIGRGSIHRSVYLENAPAGTTLDDRTIQNTLAHLIHKRKLPISNGNILFMLHFPPEYAITLNGQRSCETFCAYHNTFNVDGIMTYYGVIPDHVGACADMCGATGGDSLQSITVSASHQLLEAVTDPCVGLSTRQTSPLGWYEIAQGEVGDICNGQVAQMGQWTIQLAWSNAQLACVAGPP